MKAINELHRNFIAKYIVTYASFDYITRVSSTLSIFFDFYKINRKILALWFLGNIERSQKNVLKIGLNEYCRNIEYLMEQFYGDAILSVKKLDAHHDIYESINGLKLLGITMTEIKENSGSLVIPEYTVFPSNPHSSYDDLAKLGQRIMLLDNESIRLLSSMVLHWTKSQAAEFLGLSTADFSSRLKDIFNNIFAITASQVKAPGFEFYLDPGNASVQQIRAVLSAMNKLHIAAGGLGLEFKIDGALVKVVEEVPV